MSDKQSVKGDVERASFQYRVYPWLMECFGAEISNDRHERNHRFLEEALELVQSLDCTASEAHQLVDYTFSRPRGEPSQEVGGAMVTLAALCFANELDMHEAGEIELERIWTKVEQIRAKQAAKPKHSPLPEALTPQPAVGGEVERASAIGDATLLANLNYFAELCGDARKGNKFQHVTLAAILKAAHDRLAALTARPSLEEVETGDVIQADRDAAAELIGDELGGIKRVCWDLSDEGRFVQAFRRHRLKAEAKLSAMREEERVAVVAWLRRWAIGRWHSYQKFFAETESPMTWEV